MDPADKEALMGMTEADEPSPRPSLLARAFRLLIGLTLSVLLGLGLGVLGYVGIPSLYQGFSEPAYANATRIARQQTELEDVWAEFTQSVTQQAAHQEELELTRSAAQGEQQLQVETLQAGLVQVEGHLNELEGWRNRVIRQETAVGQLAAQLEALQTEIAPGGGPLDRVQREATLTQAALHLMRARLWLIENNSGLAAREVEAAQALLAGAADDTAPQGRAPLQDVLARLELTLEDLQLRPLIAADDLEIAWQLLSNLMTNP